MRKILEKFIEFFRKKEYYEAGFDELNTYNISFTNIQDEDIKKIGHVVDSFQAVKNINYPKANLFLKDSQSFSEMSDLLSEIKKIINKDYKKTYFEAQSKNWNFIYFLTNTNGIYSNTLLVSNELRNSNEEDSGAVIYPILAIRKSKSNYHLWNQLDDYDSLDNE